jgi:hypothetical protein
MKDDTVIVSLNQQQLELLDRTIDRFPGSDRESLMVRALKEFCAEQADLSGGASDQG